MKNDNNLIQLKLGKIYEEAMQYANDPSLYNGNAGICMFGLLYCKHFKDGEVDPKLGDNIQKIIDEYLYLPSNTLANGKSGVNWFFLQMYKCDVIERQDLDEISFEDVNLSETCIKMLSKGNYDFLHGSLGIAYYLLQKGINSKFFVGYFRILNHLFSKRKDGMIGNFNFIQDTIEEDRVNIGLAHGIVSILKFCVQCYANKVSKKASHALAQKIINYLRSNQNVNKDCSYFSNLIIDNIENNEGSRLGWCYGDLTIAYVLYQSAILFKDSDIEEFALEVFYHSMKRVTGERTYVRDAGLCHGTAGIAHIYNKMWYLTKDKSFKNACDFWIDQTLKFDKFDDTISGYKLYYPPTNTYLPSSGLLEGSVGVGLVLISYLTGDFDWDYCLMLN